MAYPSIPRDLLRRTENENFPLVGLAALRELRRALDDLEAAAILRAREMGASAADIGEALGLTRQAAHYRIRHILDRQDQRATEDGTIIIPDTEDSPQR